MLQLAAPNLSSYRWVFQRPLIKANSKNKDVLNGLRQNLKPTAIIRVGGTLKPDAGEDLPEGWPNPKFAPESLPVVFLYDFTKESFLTVKSFHSKSLTPVGTLGDVRRWIEDSRNQERFIFSTIVLGILSIVIIVLDWAYYQLLSLYWIGQSQKAKNDIFELSPIVVSRETVALML